MNRPTDPDEPYVDDKAAPITYAQAVTRMRSMLRLAAWDRYLFVQEDPHTFLVFKGTDPIPVNRIKLPMKVIPDNLLGVHRG